MCGYFCSGCGKCKDPKATNLPLGYCEKCGTSNSVEAKVCSNCGEPIPEREFVSLKYSLGPNSATK